MNTRVAILIIIAVFYLPVIAIPDEPAKAEKPDADQMLGKKVGQVRDDNGPKMKLIWCSPGFVPMEQTQIVDDSITTAEGVDATIRVRKITPVKVFLTSGYWLGKYEVTQSEWTQVMQSEPWKDRDHVKEGADFPASWVDANEADEFCRKLTEQERAAGRLPAGWQYSLPTEAQWERACRARTETRYSFGNNEAQLGEYAWYRDNSWNREDDHPRQVGQKKPNPWGFFDMHGNVHEWCYDDYVETLSEVRDPAVKLDETADRRIRVCRGGACSIHFSGCTSACRNAYRPTLKGNNLGLRVALSRVR